MAKPTFMTCGKVWDAHHLLQWETINFQADWSGEYTYDYGAGIQSGTIGGSSLLTLTKQEYDAAAAGTATAQGLDGTGTGSTLFTSFTSRCPCPSVLANINGIDGANSVTESIHDEPTVGAPSDVSSASLCAWVATINDLCGEGETEFSNIGCTLNDGSATFDAGPFWMVAPAAFNYGASSAPYTENFEADILYLGDIVGSQTVTLTVWIGGGESGDGARGNTLDSTPLSTGGLESGSLQTGRLRSGSLQTGTLRSGTLDTGTLRSGGLQVGTLRSGVLETGSTSSGTLQTSTIETGGSLSLGGLTTSSL